MALTLGCHKSSCTHLFDYIVHLYSPHRLQQFLGNLELKVDRTFGLIGNPLAK